MHKAVPPTVLLLLLTGCKPAPSVKEQRRTPAPVHAAGPASQPSTQPTPTNGYADAEHGVSFLYPTVWTTSHDEQGYLPSAILNSPGVHPKQVVTLYPQGTVYQGTNLSNLNFTYALLLNSTVQSCFDVVSKNQDSTSPATTVKVDGVPFTEVTGSDAGMSHRLLVTLDATFHNGTCYLFERDEATIAPGVQPGTRTLTDPEERALQRSLSDIFQSLRFQ